MTTIGTTNASTTTMISCFGDLIGEECWSGSFIFSCWSNCARAAGKSKQTKNYTVTTFSSASKVDARVCESLKSQVHAPVAQLDRVLVSEAKGHRFESC